MQHSVSKCVTILALSCLGTGFAAAQSAAPCGPEMLKGRYVFTATGFTRPPTSTPGTAWTPKAILETLVFNGDGSLTTPGLVAANPFGDLGNILQPPAGAPGAYIVNEDCSGRIHFFDATGVMFAIYVEPRGDAILMIQTSPSNNVFQGSAKRVP